jgi:hypothetical protein
MVDGIRKPRGGSLCCLIKNHPLAKRIWFACTDNTTSGDTTRGTCGPLLGTTTSCWLSPSCSADGTDSCSISGLPVFSCSTSCELARPSGESKRAACTRASRRQRSGDTHCCAKYWQTLVNRSQSHFQATGAFSHTHSHTCFVKYLCKSGMSLGRKNVQHMTQILITSITLVT